MYTSNILALAALSGIAIAAPAPQSGFYNTVNNLQSSISGVINDIAQQRPAFSDFSTTGRSLDSFRKTYFPPNCPQVTGLPAPATSSAQAIQYLQQVQLDLNIVTQDTINGDTTSALSQICAAINLYNGGLGNFLSSSTSTSSIKPTSTPVSSSGVTSSATPPITKSATVSSSSASASPTPTDCTTQENACRTAPNANQAFCSSQAASCKATCDTSFDSCQTAPNANHAFCASQYAGCLGYNPFAPSSSSSSSSAPVTTSASSTITSSSTTSVTPTPTPSSCQSTFNTCRAEINANESYCAAQDSACETTCENNFDVCKTAPEANLSYCASLYAGCLGYNPFFGSSSSSSTATSTPVVYASSASATATASAA